MRKEIESSNHPTLIAKYTMLNRLKHMHQSACERASFCTCILVGIEGCNRHSDFNGPFALRLPTILLR
jgi:hypothetical protein